MDGIPVNWVALCIHTMTYPFIPRDNLEEVIHLPTWGLIEKIPKHVENM